MEIPQPIPPIPGPTPVLQPQLPVSDTKPPLFIKPWYQRRECQAFLIILILLVIGSAVGSALYFLILEPAEPICTDCTPVVNASEWAANVFDNSEDLTKAPLAPKDRGDCIRIDNNNHECNCESEETNGKDVFNLIIDDSQT